MANPVPPPPHAPSPSLWLSTLPRPLPVRPSLTTSITADVAVVGGGFTGLWTAYHLHRLAPTLRVVVLEAQHCGFGASGRNGGWVSSEYAQTDETIIETKGPKALVGLRSALRSSVDAIGEFWRRELGADPWVGFHKGGSMVFARTAPQQARVQDLVARAQRVSQVLASCVGSGTGWDAALASPDRQLLGQEATRALANVSGVLCAAYTPHCAAVNPGALVTGLAGVVERSGSAIYERTRVQSVEGTLVRTQGGGSVDAKAVVWATEAFAAPSTQGGRLVVPLYTLMVATEPLSEATWAAIGMCARPTMSEAGHTITYCQRTQDGRLAFGGRGPLYRMGSQLQPDAETDAATHKHLQGLLRQWFPVLGADVKFTHAWGGAVAMTRDHGPFVWWDGKRSVGGAGGYVGDGVTMSYVAGRCLAEMITGQRSVWTAPSPYALPCLRDTEPVGEWEPEPLRSLGINAGILGLDLADREEALTGRPSVIAKVVGPIVGH